MGVEKRVFGNNRFTSSSFFLPSERCEVNRKNVGKCVEGYVCAIRGKNLFQRREEFCFKRRETQPSCLLKRRRKISVIRRDDQNVHRRVRAL